MTRIGPVFALALILATPVSVQAQGTRDAWGGRGFITVAAGVQTESPAFGYSFSTELFEEQARAGLDTPGRNGVAFEFGGGVRLVQNFGFGVAYSRYSKDRTATLSARIPSPFFMNQDSTVQRFLPLQREEQAVHFQLIYRIPIINRLQLGLFGGPTFFQCSDDSVDRFALEGDVSPDLDWSVDFREVNQTIHKDNAWGYNAGADVTYMVGRRVGLGVTMRYSRASHNTNNPFSDTSVLSNEGVWGGHAGTGSFAMKHGGMQWSGGISFRF